MPDQQKPWRRYRFVTRHEDYRPAIFNPRYPWWCSGITGDDGAVIVAYLPPSESLADYWDDAEEVDFSEEDAIKFTDRFARPAWFTGDSP